MSCISQSLLIGHSNHIELQPFPLNRLFSRYALFHEFSKLQVGKQNGVYVLAGGKFLGIQRGAILRLKAASEMGSSPFPSNLPSHLWRGYMMSIYRLVYKTIKTWLKIVKCMAF